jgi:hypothetical protein
MKGILSEALNARKFSRSAHESLAEVTMKKKTTITSEKHEVWKIRRGDDCDSPGFEDVAIDVDQPDKPANIPQLPEPNETHIDEV